MAYISNIDAVNASSGTTKNYKLKDSEARQAIQAIDLSDRLVKGINPTTSAVVVGALRFGDISANVASGSYSHAEGESTTASGDSSHAEGNSTTASGRTAHSEGIYTIANHKSQHVFGEYNVADPSNAATSVRGNYIEIVGNGTDTSARSNARTLDWSGNETLAGSITLGKGTVDETSLTAAELAAIKSGGAVQSDWNENDSTLDSYIQNRPFYDNSEVLIDNKAFGLDEQGMGLISTDNSLVVGNTYHVYITDYDLGTVMADFEAIAILNANNKPEISDTTSDFTFISETGYLYIISQTHSRENVYVTITDVQLQKIDAKYIPDVLNGKLTIGANPTNNMDVATKQYVDEHSGSSLQWTIDNDGTGDVSLRATIQNDVSNNVASGVYSHAEGSCTTASSYTSHAEGCRTTASGEDSHAEGYETIAAGSYQHVEGKYNISDNSDTYAHIVGNGTASDARSNAYTLDWSGNESLAGSLTLGMGTTAAITLTPAILNQLINGGSDPIYTNVTLSAASWTLDGTSGYYTQSVTVSGVTSTSKFRINGIIYPSGTTLDSKAGIDFAASLLLNSDTQTNTIIFNAVEKPDTDFTIELEVK